MVYHRSEATGSRADRNRSAPPSRTQPAARNAFRNDGSFLEMFKKMQEAGASSQTSAEPRSRPESDSDSSSARSDVPAPSCGAAASCGPAASYGPAVSYGPAAGGAVESGPVAGPEATSASVSASAGAMSAPKKAQPLVGKRRGGRVLPTGVVKKKRTDEDDEEDKPKDAWSLYMAEVRRYKETSCEEDGKTRPLVK